MCLTSHLQRHSNTGTLVIARDVTERARAELDDLRGPLAR